MTIADKILFMLRQQEWVTTSEFLNAGLYTFRNRVSELNRHGYTIEAEKLPGKSIFRYRLKEE
jgi:hypothetical protein